MPPLERAEQDAVGREDPFPGQGPDHERDEEREQKQEQVGRLAPAAVERDPVGERIGDDQGGRGGDGREPRGEQELRVVERDGLAEVGEVPRQAEPLIDVACLKRYGRHEQDGNEEEHRQPQAARQDQSVGSENLPQTGPVGPGRRCYGLLLRGPHPLTSCTPVPRCCSTGPARTSP